MTTSTVNRKPGDCRFDLEEVCREIEFQNSSGNKLKSWVIEDDEITLKFE